ncbi:unnamed protein product, partial [Symbiodinium natans]
PGAAWRWQKFSSTSAKSGEDATTTCSVTTAAASAGGSLRLSACVHYQTLGSSLV